MKLSASLPLSKSPEEQSFRLPAFSFRYSGTVAPWQFLGGIEHVLEVSHIDVVTKLCGKAWESDILVDLLALKDPQSRCTWGNQFDSEHLVAISATKLLP